MDFIILFCTAKVRKIKCKLKNIFLSSIIGSICSLFIFIISTKIRLKNMEIILSLAIKIIISIIMINIAFKPKIIKKQEFYDNKILYMKDLIKTLIVFYLISYVIAGVALSVMYGNSFLIANTENIINKIKKGMSQSYLLIISILSGIIGVIIVILSFKYNKSKIKREDLICNLIIRVNSKIVKIKALIDTGNSLKFENMESVIIVERNKLFDELEFEEYIEKGSDNTKLRLIPFKSIGKEKGVLIGIKPDEAFLVNGEEEYMSFKKQKLENVILGLYDKKIGKKYSAIIGIDAIH